MQPSPTWLTQTLSCHVMASSSIQTNALFLAIVAIVTCVASLQTWTPLVTRKTITISRGLVARSLFRVTCKARETTAWTRYITNHSLPVFTTSAVARRWITVSMKTQARLGTVQSPFASGAWNFTTRSSETRLALAIATQRVTANRWRKITAAHVGTVLSIAIFPTWFVTVGAMIAIQTLADTGGLLKRSREFNVNKTLWSRDLPGGCEGGGGENLSEMLRGRLPFLESLR